MGKKRAIVIGVLLAFSLALSGCKKTKPPLPPPQAQAPTIPDTNVPGTIPEVPVPQPEPAPTPTKPAPTITKKPKSRPRGEAKRNPLPPQPSAPAPGDKAVIEEGGKQPDPAQPPLVAEANPQAAQQRINTNQLLSAAEYNINNLHRTLTTDDQAIIQHIRGFIDQSRQAMKDGDMERAYTLATKARLMSDELVKR